MTMPTRAQILWNLEIKSHSRAIKWSHFLDCDADEVNSKMLKMLK